MDCVDARRAIEDAPESLESLDSVESHLQTCAECRDHCEGLESLRQELADWPATVPDDTALHAIRTEVLQKLAARRLWGPRLGWAAVLIVTAGGMVAGWGLRQRQPTLELAARFEPPAAPEIVVEMPLAKQTQSAAPAQRLATQEANSAEPPKVKIAAVIEPAPETESRGGVLLELESENPNVVLYFLADYRGD